jgi:hypothetical protein
MQPINPTGRLINVVLNERISDADQADGASIDNQDGILREFCKRNLFNPIATFSEQASGFNGVRKTIEEAYEFCKAFNKKNPSNPIRYHLSITSDRYFRNIENHYIWKAEFRKIGVGVQLADAWDYGDEASLFRGALNAAASEASSRKNSYHTLRNMYEWGLKGKPCSNIPTGIYRYVNPKNKNDFDFTLNEYGRNHIRAFHLIAQGQAKDVVWKNMGRRKAFGCGRTQFFDNLRNPMYCLEYFLDGTKAKRESKVVSVFSSQPETFLPKHIFQAAQDVMDGKAINRKTKHAQSFAGKGLLSCSLCSHTFSTSTPQGRNQQYFYYAIKKGYCNNACNRNSTRIQAKMIHPVLSQIVKGFSISGSSKAKLDKMIKQRGKQMKSAVESHLRTLRIELSKAKQRQQRALQLILDQVPGKPSVITPEQKIAIDNAVMQLENKIAKVSVISDQKNKILQMAIRFAANLHELYEQAQTIHKNLILNTIFPEGLEFQVESQTAVPIIFRTARINSIFSLIDSKSAAYRYIIVEPVSESTKTGSLGAQPDLNRTELEDIRLLRNCYAALGLAG